MSSSSSGDSFRIARSRPAGFIFGIAVAAPMSAACSRRSGPSTLVCTWCHHLIVDFLFVHPRICGKIEPVKGVGVGLLQGICLIARSLQCKRVWGEATLDSASFYEHHLHRTVEDTS